MRGKLTLVGLTDKDALLALADATAVWKNGPVIDARLPRIASLSKLR